jgi:hypothetical protein
MRYVGDRLPVGFAASVPVSIGGWTLLKDVAEIDARRISFPPVTERGRCPAPAAHIAA